jgi:hypothetical protein
MTIRQLSSDELATLFVKEKVVPLDSEFSVFNDDDPFLSSTMGHPKSIRVTGSSRKVAVEQDPFEAKYAGLLDRRGSGRSFRTWFGSVRRPVVD